MSKMKLTCRGQLDRVRSMTKTTQGNDMTDRTGTINTKNDSKMSGTIELGAFCDENQTTQQRD